MGAWWQVGCLYCLVLGTAVRYVTSLEEELADSIFGEFQLLFRIAL